MPKCHCGADIAEGKQYCTWHDPTKTEAEKRAIRARGGANSRKIPHNLQRGDYTPLTRESLQRLYSDLLDESLTAYRDDLAGLIKALSRFLPKVSELIAYENLQFLEERLAQLEAGKSHKFLIGKADYVELGNDSKPD